MSQVNSSKTALVLGGGGFTGGVYQIGALRALDLLSVNRSINQFDVYVGTSAGAFVAALVANGMSPEEMMRFIDQRHPALFPALSVGTLLKPNLGDIAKRVVKLPGRTVKVASTLFSQIGQLSSMDLFLNMAEFLPPGLYSGAGIERYLHAILSENGRTESFGELENELYLAATDLNTCERIVFGSKEWNDVPISKAVRASTALPMVYQPTEINGRQLVDGGITSTTNIDVAVKAGAKLVVVVNPLVPYIHDADSEKLAEMGFPQVGYQAFKLLTYRRLHEATQNWQERYPGVDIVLIEPEPDDHLMFQTNIMNFSSRVAIAQHGFKSVTMKLAEDYDYYHEVCERHGIEISAKRVRQVVSHFTEDEPERTSAWRKIFEQTTSALLKQSQS